MGTYLTFLTLMFFHMEMVLIADRFYIHRYLYGEYLDVESDIDIDILILACKAVSGY